jgi:hypothetical protein
MAVTPNSTQVVSEPKALMKRQADIIIMLARGHTADGKVSHELMKHINLIFSISISKATVHRLWKNYGQVIPEEEAPQLTRKSGSGRIIKHGPDDLKGKSKMCSFTRGRRFKACHM